VKDKRIFRDGEPPEIITRDVLREVFGVEAKIMPGDDGVPYFIPTGSVSAPAASVN
jgi:iron complex transport system ATP-binding protein